MRFLDLICYQKLQKSQNNTFEYLIYTIFIFHKMYTLIKGKVIEGKQLGRTLGFRTANVEIADNIIAE